MPLAGKLPTARLLATALRNLADMVEREEAKLVNFEASPQQGIGWESTVSFLHRRAWWEWDANEALPEPSPEA